MKRKMPMTYLIDVLKKTTVFDLSHKFHAGIPHASVMPEETSKVIYNIDPDGFQAHLYSFAGQWGTHIDAPIHFAKGGRTLDQIEASELILPFIVIDCSEEVEKDNDYLLSLKKVMEHEKQFGEISSNSFVAMKTNWSSRWPDPEKMANKDNDGTAHFPGWSVEAVKFLIEARNITAIGHEPMDTDGGRKVSVGNFECEDYLLCAGKYQIEMLASLQGIPQTGAIVIVGVPKPLGGSGFPARVMVVAENG